MAKAFVAIGLSIWLPLYAPNFAAAYEADIAGIDTAAAAYADLLASPSDRELFRKQLIYSGSDSSRLNYGICLRMGRKMVGDGLAVLPATYAVGLSEALGSGEAYYTDPEIDVELSKLQSSRSGEDVSGEPDWTIASYGLARRLGERLVRDGYTLEPIACAWGLSDAVRGGAPILTEEEIEAAVTRYQTEVLGPERRASSDANLEEGRRYMAQMSIREEAQITESGLIYIVIEAGEGESQTLEDSVEVHYEGRLIDGSVFDSSFERGQTVTFGLTQVIAGWTEGLQLMRPGGKFRFVIPPELAYGDDGVGQMIGPNATLLFDIQLIKVVR